MKVQLMTVTPEMAKRWMAKNTRNRKLRQTVVTAMSDAILRGEWKLNGETIKINNDIVVDGQHRLAAIILANAAVQSLVAMDVDSDCIATIDTGIRRSLADYLALRGEANSSRLATVLTWAHRFADGTGARMGIRPTIQQAMALLKAEPSIRDIPAQGDNWYRAFPPMPQSIFMGGYYRLRKIDKQDAFDFFDMIANGTDLKEGSPIAALRSRLIKNESAKAKLNDSYILALVFKAWNAYRTGSPLNSLKWASDGPRGEDFPIPE